MNEGYHNLCLSFKKIFSQTGLNPTKGISSWQEIAGWASCKTPDPQLILTYT